MRRVIEIVHHDDRGLWEVLADGEPVFVASIRIEGLSRAQAAASLVSAVAGCAASFVDRVEDEERRRGGAR